MALMGGKISISTAILIVLGVLLAVLLAADALSRVEVITPEAQLQSKLETVRWAVVDYSQAHGQAPDGLSELSLKPQDLTDCLGHRMAYSVDRAHGRASLTGDLRPNYFDTWKIVVEFPIAAPSKQ
jgi:hypothetical protein